MSVSSFSDFAFEPRQQRGSIAMIEQGIKRYPLFIRAGLLIEKIEERPGSFA
jgi:hypothetical protein